MSDWAPQVIVAGTSQQVSEALKEAEDFREPLVERGVLVVPLPIFEDSNAEKDKQNQLNDTDLRYGSSCSTVSNQVVHVASFAPRSLPGWAGLQ